MTTATAAAVGLHTLAQLGALLAIRHEPATFKSIAAATGVSSAAVTGIADRLEQLGLAERLRTPGDRRSYKLTLTAKGREFLTDLLS